MSAAPSAEELSQAIGQAAVASGFRLEASSLDFLVGHARAIYTANELLHLTAITEPRAFVDRHLRESFEGAALLGPDMKGALLDLGSGNGYPGLAVAAARPALCAHLAEASSRKAEFLRSVIEGSLPEARVIERHVQRATDLEDFPRFQVVTARAMGGWERTLPRLAGRLEPAGRLLVWAGVAMETVRSRAVWRRYTLVDRRALPGRERSWVWCFGRSPNARPTPN